MLLVDHGACTKSQWTFKQFQNNKTTYPHGKCVGSPRCDDVSIYGVDMEGPIDLSESWKKWKNNGRLYNLVSR